VIVIISAVEGFLLPFSLATFFLNALKPKEGKEKNEEPLVE
jgi:hypothetical protein